LSELADASAITLRLAHLKTAVRSTLERDGVLARLGRDKVHGNVYRAVQAQIGEPGPRPEGNKPL